MVLSKENSQTDDKTSTKKLNSTAKRRNRRNKLRSALSKTQIVLEETPNNSVNSQETEVSFASDNKGNVQTNFVAKIPLNNTKMSSNENKPRDDVLAARQAKKLTKQKGKGKDAVHTEKDITDVKETKKNNPESVTTVKDDVTLKKLESCEAPLKVNTPGGPKADKSLRFPRGQDEVDRVMAKVTTIEGDKNKEQIKAERAAKKAAKQSKKKGPETTVMAKENAGDTIKNAVPIEPVTKPANDDMTVKDVVETLRDIVNVAREIQDVTVKVNAIDLGGKKVEEVNKSKAELRAERRAKQEAQRAAKQATQEQKMAPKPKAESKLKPDGDAAKAKEASPAPKQKSTEKSKAKSGTHRVNWFQHLYSEHDKEALKSIAINSSLHPAIVKLGVQLASRVVMGSNARCVALLDALKKMVRDYTLPAKTEFARGLESHLASSIEYLWAMRPPSASQTNAIKFFRHHLTQLPNNVDEFDAKKTLQEEIDRYIREQIDMAGEAISIAVRNKISTGDNILTYGCSSLIERILRDAWSSGLHFRTVVVGNRVQPAAAEMLRRLVAHGLPCTYVDITALGYVMKTVSKAVVGAGALLGNGSVLAAAGTAQVALAARARNVPLLVACETHKFCDRVQTDAFVYNEIGDPDDLVNISEDTSPLKDWRSNPNLTPLNLSYDVTPPSLVTAVVTELAILPCTSAPVVLRFKLSEYGV